MDVVLIKLVDMDFNEIFSEPDYRYLGFTGGSDFN